MGCGWSWVREVVEGFRVFKSFLVLRVIVICLVFIIFFEGGGVIIMFSL